VSSLWSSTGNITVETRLENSFRLFSNTRNCVEASIRAEKCSEQSRITACSVNSRSVKETNVPRCAWSWMFWYISSTCLLDTMPAMHDTEDIMSSPKTTLDGIKTRKKYKLKSGTVCLREIKKIQKTTKLLIQKSPFKRMVKEITTDCTLASFTRRLRLKISRRRQKTTLSRFSRMRISKPSTATERRLQLMMSICQSRRNLIFWLK